MSEQMENWQIPEEPDTAAGIQAENENLPDTASSVIVRSTVFAEDDKYPYERSNDLALGYYNMSPNEYRLLTAAFACAYNANKVCPFTEDELSHGPIIGTTIMDVAKLMGYDERAIKNRSFYRGIKNAALHFNEKTSILIENKEKTSFLSTVIIHTIDYNPNNSGWVYFHFAPKVSKYFLNNTGSFTLYSLMLRNKVEKFGSSAAVRLHEVLQTSLYIVKSNPSGCFTVNYDFIDLKCKLQLIDSGEKTSPVINKIINDPDYSDFRTNPQTAYKRLLRIEKIETDSKKELDDYIHSPEYLNADPQDKETYKAIKDKEQSLRENVKCKYGDWGDFKKRVLVPAQKTYAMCYRDYPSLMEFMFEYKPIYYMGKVITVSFTIYTIDAYRKKEREKGVQLCLEDYLKEIEIKQAKSVDLFEGIESPKKVTPDEINKRGKRKRTEKKDDTIDQFAEYVAQSSSPYKFKYSEISKLADKAEFDILKEKYDLMVKSKTPIEYPVKWMMAAIREDYKETQAKNGFNAFEQNDYDFDALEKDIMSN